MLSFFLRRALLRSGTFPTARVFQTRAIFPNHRLTWVLQRSLAVTSNDLNSGSTADSEPEPESKPKSRGRKAGPSTKVAGKDKSKTDSKRRAKTAVKQKITIKSQDRPPKAPGSAYTLWFTDWCRSQPKSESREAAQNNVKQGAQIWSTVSDYDKQRYQEKFNSLRAEYVRRIEEWREHVDPVILRELNRRRVAKGLSRIRGPRTGRPMPGFFRYFQRIREEYPRTEDDQKAYFKAVAGWASGQWKALSDAEKAKYNDPARAEFAAWRENRKAESQAKK
ncbi:hypothetical protein BJV78DRAFT_1213722 [Lactifluus subvellereus]|nr:hypothetical protein BJV78DRAFT_1213722 [Lactifluus subvellereus]